NTNGLLPILGAFAVSLGAMALKGAGAFTALSKIVGIARVGAAVFTKWLLPALLLEDFLTWLSGGDSVFGDAMVAAFGGEDAEAIRQDVLAFFEKLKQLAKDILPDVKAIFESDEVKLLGTILKESILGTLNLIAFLLTDSHERQSKFLGDFRKNTETLRAVLSGLYEDFNKLMDHPFVNMFQGGLELATKGPINMLFGRIGKAVG